MKFLAFVDSHEDPDLHEILLQKSTIHDVDFILCLGDFTWFGSALVEELQFINSLPKKVFLFHGNHEPHKKTEELCDKLENITFVHEQIFSHQGVTFVCYGGGGFSEYEPEFEAFIEKNKEVLQNAKKIVLATHAPPKDTKLDTIHEGYNVGCQSYKTFIEEYHPLLAISGHIHESYKQKDIVGTTLLVNPGGDGEVFDISNKQTENNEDTD